MAFSNLTTGCTDWLINIAGSNSTWTGIIFAPNGQIDTSGSTNSTINGSLIGWTIKMSGSGLTVDASGSGPGTFSVKLSE